MFFSPKKLLIGASCLLFTATRADYCPDGPWTDVLMVGGDGGETFCATKWDQGAVVSGVEVWATDRAIRAIQFYYSDGTNSAQFGRVDGDRHARLDWDPATDTISQLKLWGNGKGEYTGRVQIRTRTGKELDVGKDTGGQDTFEIAVASGIMLGGFGAATNSVDRLGFLFLKSKVKKVSIDDVVFSETPEELNKRMEGLETVTLDYADHTNDNTNGNQTQDFTFGKSETRTTSKKWSNSGTHAFGFSTATEISGKLLDLGASSTTTLSYSYTQTNTEDTGEDKSVTLTYSVATTLKPGQRVFCRATAMKGTYKGDYSATVNVWLEDGSKFGFAKGGTMEQVNWSKASSVCQDKDFGPSEKKIGRRFIA